MPYYSLRRMDDFTDFPGGNYPNRDAAIAYFSETIGVKLSLQEVAPSGPEYMMHERDDPVGWVDFTIPVWIARGV